VPVVVDVAQVDSSGRIPALARERFVSRLAGSTGDEPRAQRLFTREADRGKLMVVVLGLDDVVEAKPRVARRSTVATLLGTCLEERLPFIAGVSDELAPQISEVAVIRVKSRRDREEARIHLYELLARRGVMRSDALERTLREAFNGDETTVDAWHLEVAADVIVARMRDGQEPPKAVQEIFAIYPARRRELSWTCEKALGCSVQDSAQRSFSVARALSALGRQAHYRQELTTQLRDVTRGFSAVEDLRFAGSLSVLARRNVLTVVGDATDPGVRFKHPEWLTLAGALGMELDEGRWSDLLTPGVPQATLNSLTAALDMHQTSAGPDEPSFLTVLSRLKQDQLHDLSLDMILAVIKALQVDGRPLRIGDPELVALRRAWQVSTDQARLLFVSTVKPHPAIADFFWEQVIPPLFEMNSFRLRRAICARLSGMGPVAWQQLASRWTDLVVAAAQADLTARARLTKADWWRFGLPLASAAWVLPSLTDRVADGARDDALRLLQNMRRVVTVPGSPGGVKRSGTPDLGLEISLAEGYKLASVARLGRLSISEQAWQTEARRLLRDSRSWTSQLILYQALTLSDVTQSGAGGGAAHTSGGTASRNHARHPFAREAEALAQRALDSADATFAATGSEEQTVAAIGRDIWFDDVEALEDGGFGLSPEAHRLLALSTFLINLAEGAHSRAVQAYRRQPGGEPSEEVLCRVDARELALTSTIPPKCFMSAGHTATILDVECDCQFRLCGRDARGAVGDRQISRAFAERAEITAGSRPVLGREAGFVRRAFAQVWRRPEMVRDEIKPSP
jgi:hypothetical protein